MGFDHFLLSLMEFDYFLLSLMAFDHFPLSFRPSEASGEIFTKRISLDEISRLRHFVPTLEMTKKRTLEMTKIVLGNGVVAGAAPGMAAQNTAQGQPGTLEKPVLA